MGWSKIFILEFESTCFWIIFPRFVDTLRSINLVSIFRCSSSKTNPVYGRRVNSFVLVLVFHHTDTYLYLLSLALALSIHNKLKDLIPTRPGRGSGVEGDGWKYGCGGEGVAAGRRAWPCSPRSPLQNGTFWRSSEASWGSSKGYREKSLNLTNCHFT